MNSTFEIQWSNEALFTFNRLSADAQTAFLKQLPVLVLNYAKLYAQKPAAHQQGGLLILGSNDSTGTTVRNLLPGID